MRVYINIFQTMIYASPPPQPSKLIVFQPKPTNYWPIWILDFKFHGKGVQNNLFQIIPKGWVCIRLIKLCSVFPYPIENNRVMTFSRDLFMLIAISNSWHEHFLMKIMFTYYKRGRYRVISVRILKSLSIISS